MRPTKISTLASKLGYFGLGPLPQYNEECAGQKRKAYIGGLDPEKFEGVILPKEKGSIYDVKSDCN
jgi:hypothetical protein